MTTQERQSDTFMHLGWISIVLAIASFFILTPIVGVAGLIAGIISGLKGHVTGWIGGLISFLMLAGWLTMLIYNLAEGSN